MLALDKILKTLDTEIGDMEIDDVIDDNFPKDSDTIGQLQGKLTCCCIQMWNNQEFLYASRRMTADEFETEHKNDIKRLHKMIKRCCDLNNQRAQLMDAIDTEAVRISEDK